MEGKESPYLMEEENAKLATTGEDFIHRQETITRRKTKKKEYPDRGLGQIREMRPRVIQAQNQNGFQIIIAE